MADIEKVINVLEKAKNIIEQWIPLFEQHNTPSAIDDAIALLKEQPKWISPKDAMPEANKPVLIHEGNWVTMLVYTRRKVRGKVVERWEYEHGGIYHDRVDGWMPLPKAPINK